MSSTQITIDGGGTSLRLAVGDDGRLHQVALGGPEVVAADPAFPTALYPLALPTFGEEALREPALRVTHVDGSVSTRLVVDDVADAPHDHGVDHRIALVDRARPLRVVLCLRTWPEHDLVEQWLEVANEGGQPIRLHQLASASPAMPGSDPHLTHWSGGWANEWTETTEPLALGVKSLASAGGVRPSLHLPPIVLCAPEGRATETTGSVLATTVRWGGDVRFDAELAPHRQLRLIAGTQHRGAERVLGPGERFASPPAVLAWSDEGIGSTSRALHRWVRRHVVRDGERPRSIAFNNWEAMGFSLDTESVQEVIDGAAAAGAELFLLDDGWFGTTHPRDDDTQGLGDWDVDRRKFPDGLGPVVDHALARGLRFGLWVEPEMVNPASALYERHPDWVIAEPGRDRREERQQLVLDVCRPEVRAFVVDVIDRALAQAPGTSYLKWDANRDLFEQGSEALASDRQSHLAVDRVRATEEIMAEVARRHPEVELMLCASGGGRSDLATLAHFHELWTSDNTDPVDRVRIQWGASHLLPANVLGAHVTRWGQQPVELACAVALSARFGFDIDPRTMTDEERATAADAAAVARRIRHLVQQGDLHRLVSPVGGPRGSVAFLEPGSVAGVAVQPADVPVAVVFAYRLEPSDDIDPPMVVPGLAADRTYLVEDVTPGPGGRAPVVVRSGSQLAAAGLDWPDVPAPSARIWLVSPSR
jgi:alpha-galactosidase